MSNEKKEQKDQQQVNILLARHGKTLFNHFGRIQGWCDSPLTEEGQEVAEYLGRGLKDYPLDAIYSSTSGRAADTAEIILEEGNFAHLPQKKLKSFRELFFGKYEGDQVQILDRDAARVFGVDENAGILSGAYSIEQLVYAIVCLNEPGFYETWEEYTNRLLTGLNTVVKDAQDKGYKEVLVVTHSFSINAILAMFQKDPEFIYVANASISKLVYADSEFKVESVNDTSFVEKGKISG